MVANRSYKEMANLAQQYFSGNKAKDPIVITRKHIQPTLIFPRQTTLLQFIRSQSITTHWNYYPNRPSKENYKTHLPAYLSYILGNETTRVRFMPSLSELSIAFPQYSALDYEDRRLSLLLTMRLAIRDIEKNRTPLQNAFCHLLALLKLIPTPMYIEEGLKLSHSVTTIKTMSILKISLVLIPPEC